MASHATTINAVPASEGRQQGMYSSTGIGSKPPPLADDISATLFGIFVIFVSSIRAAALVSIKKHIRPSSHPAFIGVRTGKLGILQRKNLKYYLTNLLNICLIRHI